MYLKRGARGREALPNFEFWIAFPGLIKVSLNDFDKVTTKIIRCFVHDLT